MTGAVASPEQAGRELARMLATLAWVVAAATLVLVVLGALPGRLGGEPRDPRRAASVEDAERRLGARLAFPAYYPDRLAWPPARIRVAGGKGGSAEILLAPRPGHPGVPVELFEAAGPGGAIHPALLGERTVLRVDRTTVGSRPASISDVRVEGGAAHELAFELDGRPILLRSSGDLDELYRMARSAQVEGR